MDYFYISCMEGPVYKTDPMVTWCDFNHILILESILGTPVTNMKFWKEFKKKSENKYREKNQGDEPGKGIFTEFLITE